MKKLSILFFLIGFAFCRNGFSQDEYWLFENAAVDNYNTKGAKILKTTDGYILVGLTEDMSTPTNYFVFLSKFNSCMTLQWTKLYGLSNTFYADPHHLSGLSLVITHSGGMEDGYVFAVSQRTDNATCCPYDQDIYLCKTDLDGIITWDKVLQTSAPDRAFQIIECANSDLVFLGSTEENGNADVFLCRLDAGGGIWWKRNYDFSDNDDVGFGVIENPANELVIVGMTGVHTTNTDGFVIKTNGSGGIIWSERYYSTPGYCEGFSTVENAQNGEYYISGHIKNEISPSPDLLAYDELLVLRIDDGGNIVWDRQYYHGNLYAPGFVPIHSSVDDNGYLALAGYIENTGLGSQDEDFLIAKFNSSGDLEWARSKIDFEQDGSLNSVEFVDGWLLTAGRYFHPFDQDNYDFETPIFRLKANGDNCFLEELKLIEHETDLTEIHGDFIPETSGMAPSTVSTDLPEYDFSTEKICGKDECPNDFFCYTIKKEKDIDNGEAIIPSKSGGFVVAGSMHRDIHGSDRDMYVVKYANDFENPVFSVRLGFFPALINNNESGFSVIERPDGYFICGSIDFSATNADVFVVKLKPDGHWDWGMRYGKNNNSIDVGRKILNIPSGGSNQNDLLVTGFTNVSGNFDFLSLRIDPSDGHLINGRIYGGFEDWNEMSYDAIACGDNEFLLVGEQIDGLTGLHNMAAVRISISLDISTSGGNGGIVVDNAGRSQCAFSAALLGHNIYLAGWITNTDDGYPDMYVVEMPTDLSLISNNRIYKSNGENLTEVARKIKKAKNNMLIMAGIYDDQSQTDGLVLKINPAHNLDVDWAVKTTDQEYDQSYTDLFEVDHKIILTGAYEIPDKNKDTDILVSKISSDDGKGCCTEPYAFDYDDIEDLKGAFYDEMYIPQYAPYGEAIYDYDIHWICKEEVQRLSESNNLSTKGNSIAAANRLIISPNPSIGNFRAACSNDRINIKRIEIIDVTGREIRFRKSFEKNITTIQLENSPDGIYFLKVIDSNNQTYTSKICISK